MGGSLNNYLMAEYNSRESWRALCTDVMTAEAWADILVVLQQVHEAIRENQAWVDVGKTSEATRGWFMCQGYPIVHNQLFLTYN